MRVLVTGGAGFIGGHLVDALLARDHRVAVVDDLSTGRAEHVPAPAELVEADVASLAAVDLVARWRPEAVAHLAAHVSVRASVDDPVADARTNVLGSLAFFEACRRAAVPHWLFASSGGAAYGEARRRPTPESEPVAPTSPYGCGKVAVEGYLGFYSRVHGVRTCALRYANVYGPRQSSDGETGVVAIFAASFLRGDPPTIHGDGAQTRDYVHVRDAVAATVAALERGLAGTFNVGTGVETPTRRVADLVRAATGAAVGVRHDAERTGDARHSCLDASAIGRAAGWRPTVPLERGVDDVVAWMRRAGAPSS